MRYSEQKKHNQWNRAVLEKQKYKNWYYKFYEMSVKMGISQ